MKYSLFIIIGLSAVTLIFIYRGVFNREQSEIGKSEQMEQLVNTTAKSPWDTKSDDRLPITIRITPVEFGKSRGTWKFQVILDTHSGSLDDNLLTAVSLVDDSGNTYWPVSWDGPGPGGHHREGILAFEAVNPAPSYIELKVKNVGGVPERSFRWNIE